MFKKILYFIVLSFLSISLAYAIAEHFSKKDNIVLITGGSGYIGSATSLLMLEKGYKVIIIDKKEPVGILKEYLNNKNSNLSFICSDFSDENILNNLFQNNKIDAVIHFAAFIEVGESVKNPEKFYQNNVCNTLKLLSLMRKFSINKFIFSSSCAVYGMPNIVPINELESIKPISPYGRTKSIVEFMLQDFSKAYELKFAALRYFNAAGAIPEHNLGELHDPETHVIPLILKAAYSGNNFNVFGANYPTKDGTCIRDYLHIKDLAQAHYLALKYLDSKDSVSDFFNLGTGNGFSVKEVIDTVQNVTNKKINVVYGQPREGDPAKLIADSSKAKKVLGWNPEFSDLNTIVYDANKFYLYNNHN